MFKGNINMYIIEWLKFDFKWVSGGEVFVKCLFFFIRKDGVGSRGIDLVLCGYVSSVS